MDGYTPADMRDALSDAASARRRDRDGPLKSQSASMPPSTAAASPPVHRRVPITPPKNHEASVTPFSIGLVLVCVVASTGSAFVVLHSDEVIVIVTQSAGVRHAAYGILGALGFILMALVDGRRMKLGETGLRLMAAGVLGFFGGKIASGMGANESMQTAAAGLAGYAGPKHVDRIIHAAIDRVEKKD